MISVEQRGAVCIVSPRREVDLLNAVELEALISEAGSERHVIVSLAECSYCDSTGLAALISAKKALGDHFAMFIPPDSSVRRVFEVTNMLDYLTVFSDLDEAATFVTGAEVERRVIPADVEGEEESRP